MSTAVLTIKQVRARPVIAPLRRPVRTAVGTIPAAPLVLIDVATEEGTTGRSYLSGYNAPAALGPWRGSSRRSAPSSPARPWSRSS